MRRPYRKLNLDERRILATMLQAKATKTKIAETPAQIGNRMIQERAKLRVCQETIYRYIYSKDACAMIYGSTFQRTVLPAVHGEPENADI